MDETYVINQDLTFNEFFSSSLLIISKSKAIKKLFIVSLLPFCIDLLISLLMFLSSGFKFEYSFIFLLAFPLLLGCFIILFLLFKSIFHLRNNQDVIYTFNHWGIEKKGDKFKILIPWRQVQKYYETNSFFLFFSNEDIPIIQKKMFKDSNELNNFKNFINAKHSN